MIGWPVKKIIYGCESRGDADGPYLTRYTLLSLRGCKLYLHVFHRSDFDVMHDHPWPFRVLVLWRGYREYTPPGVKRLWPGMLLYRPADWVHRVELIDNKPSVSLVLTGRYERHWGFHTTDGWEYWKEYFRKLGC